MTSSSASFDDLDIDDEIAIHFEGGIITGVVVDLEVLERGTYSADAGSKICLHIEGYRQVKVNLDDHPPERIIIRKKTPRTPFHTDQLIDDGTGKGYESLWHWVQVDGMTLLKKLSDTVISYALDRGKYGAATWYESGSSMGNLAFKRRYPDWSYLDVDHLLPQGDCS